MLKSVSISLVGILLASISLIALASDLGISSASSSYITECIAYYRGKNTYAFATARIDSSGYYGEGYAEVGLLQLGYVYGFEMKIWADESGLIAEARSRATSLPYFYIHGYKDSNVKDTTLYSWGITYVGGNWDASAGAAATIGGWCAW
ncbi:MAG: hypothetical protein RRE21_00130 [Desulfurococcales archaeon]|nr:hypothetical protein [Desulfurococcales archaeon]